MPLGRVKLEALGTSKTESNIIITLCTCMYIVYIYTVRCVCLTSDVRRCVGSFRASGGTEWTSVLCLHSSSLTCTHTHTNRERERKTVKEPQTHHILKLLPLTHTHRDSKTTTNTPHEITPLPPSPPHRDILLWEEQQVEVVLSLELLPA